MNPASVRSQWVGYLTKVAAAPLEALASGTLKASMPVEVLGSGKDANVQRRSFSHLEAIGRTLAGIAPWLELWQGTPGAGANVGSVGIGANVGSTGISGHSSGLGEVGSASGEVGNEAELAAHFTGLVHRGLAHAVDPHSADCLNFNEGRQPLVDAAFLAHGLLRAPTVLWQALPQQTQDRLVDALRSTRSIMPGYNNWLLFSAMVEAALLRYSGSGDLLRIDYAVRQHEQWYRGDGAYGDGPEFHWDYYNSFVIQPMLLDVLETLEACAASAAARYADLLPKVRARAVRYAQVLERMIGADGAFPPLGRSLAYRAGPFQLLAQMALREELPADVRPGAARGALTAVIERTLDAPHTFDAAGWLQIGLCGHQPQLAEGYISTGSLYLCSTAFLPLGLPPQAAFWAAPQASWSQRRIWSGEDAAADTALKFC